MSYKVQDWMKGGSNASRVATFPGGGCGVYSYRLKKKKKKDLYMIHDSRKLKEISHILLLPWQK